MNNLQSTTRGLDCYTGTGKGNYWQMEFTNPYGIQSGISTLPHAKQECLLTLLVTTAVLSKHDCHENSKS